MGDERDIRALRAWRCPFRRAHYGTTSEASYAAQASMKDLVAMTRLASAMPPPALCTLACERNHRYSRVSSACGLLKILSRHATRLALGATSARMSHAA